MKECITCSIEKDLSEFYKDKRNLDGCNSWCKDCYKLYHQLNYKPTEKKVKVGVEFYVYAAKRDNEILYIGKGSGDRCNHLKSGRSHVYHANEAFFRGVPFEIEILEYFGSSRDALSKEAELVKTLGPPWNIIMPSGGTSEYFGVYGDPFKLKKKWRCEFKHNSERFSLGYYEDEIEAAKAHDKYVTEHNLSRPLNFP